MKFFNLVLVSLFILPNFSSAGDTPATGITVQAVDPAVSAEDVKERQQRPCVEAYKEYFDAKKEEQKEAKEEKKTAMEDLSKKKLEKAEKLSDLEEKISDADQEAQEAEIAYKTAADAVDVELNELEEKTHGEAQELIRALQDLNSKLLSKRTVERDALESKYRSAIDRRYNECTVAAQQMFDLKMKMEAEKNRKVNAGLLNSGGAKFGGNTKKIKKEVADLHKQCIAKVQKEEDATYSIELKVLQSAETTLTQEIDLKTKELNRLTNDQYAKKLNALNQKKAVAAAALQSQQAKAHSDKNRIAKLRQETELAMGEEISLLTARAQGIDPTKRKKSKRDRSDAEELADESLGAARQACCVGTALKFTDIRVPDSVCKEPKRGSSGSRGKN